LCNFIITDGKFALRPALPVQETSGEYITGPIPIDQLFTAGNILEDTFKIEYLAAEERRPFKAVVRFREQDENKLPQERTIEVKGQGSKYRENDVDLLPHEQFDLTQFCTSEEHALQVAKYFLVLRNLVTHTVNFSTTLEGLNIKAGSYIRVVTESSPYSSANNGTVGVSGDITSATELADGTYTVNYYKTGGNDDVQEASMSVSGGKVSGDNASDFYNAVFTVVDTTVSHNVYVVEQLTFSQEGTVDIVASEHPCDNDGKSKLVAAIQADDFKVV
jgi:predicted phage tail protein